MMSTEFRYAFRQLTKSPGFTLVAIFALALGIGANTAIFSVIDSIFLRPLPYSRPEQLVHLTSSLPERNLNAVPFSYPRFMAVRDEQQVFSDMAIGTFVGFTVTGQGDPEQVQGFHASANYLPVLGIQPLLGRNFSAEEDRPGGPAVALISDTYWKKHFNGDPLALRRQITLDGVSHTIIGVLPRALSSFPFHQIHLWTPRPAETTTLVPAQLDNGAFAFEVVARLKSGVTLRQAQEQITSLAGNYAQAYSKNADAPSQARVNGLLEDLVGDQRSTYLMLFAAVGCVLLIACANVANLLLARFTRRRKEIAVRFALGASRGQVVRQLLIESMLVAFAGAMVGLLLAELALRIFVRFGQDFILRAPEISIAPAALGFTLAITLLTGLAMGLLPALQAAAHDINETLKDSSRGSSSSPAQGRLRSSLLVSEISLSLVLLIAASLLLSSFARLQRVALGFQPERVFVGFLNIPPTKYPDGSQLAVFYRRLIDRLATVPGVESVALNDAPPLSGNDTRAPIAVVGRSMPPLSERSLALRHIVSPGMFATLGISLKSGRDFTERDNPKSPHTVIINETMARLYFPNQDPIGQQLITGMAQITAEIVGVVSDTRSANLDTPAQAEYFLPTFQRPENFSCLLVRTHGDPAAIASSVRAAMQEIDPDLPLTLPQAMTAMIARSVADRRLVILLLGAFAGLALILASIGVYSVMAYVVSQRTGEIGIRMALGATPSQVQAMVLGQGMRLVALGVAIGLGAALILTRLMETLLFEFRANDPLIFVGLAGLISAVAACACWLPARRATRVDPLDALRAD